MLSLICAWINGCVNNREAGDLRRHRVHYDVTVMLLFLKCRYSRQSHPSNTRVTYIFLPLSCYWHHSSWRSQQSSPPRHTKVYYSVSLLLSFLSTRDTRVFCACTDSCNSFLLPLQSHLGISWSHIQILSMASKDDLQNRHSPYHCSSCGHSFGSIHCWDLEMETSFNF